MKLCALQGKEKDALLSWLPAESEKIFEGCFDMEIEQLSAKERRDCNGRIGYLFSGKVEAVCADTCVVIEEKAVFGALKQSQKKGNRSESIKALEESVVVWFAEDILERVCYTACWFHARFIDEVDKLLG